MKAFKFTILTFFFLFIYNYASSQNILINVLTKNAGILRLGETGLVEISINNTSSTTAVPVYKIRPQISFPVSLVNISDTGHILPKGWSIISNSEGVIRLSNGTDQIQPHDSRTLLIAFTGINKGGPLTISGNVLFSNGVFPGSASGPATTGDNAADNSSATTCEVVKKD